MSIYVSTCVYEYTCLSTHIHRKVHKHVRIYVFVYTYIHGHVHIFTHIHTYTWKCAQAYTALILCVCAQNKGHMYILMALKMALLSFYIHMALLVCVCAQNKGPLYLHMALKTHTHVAKTHIHTYNLSLCQVYVSRGDTESENRVCVFSLHVR